MKDFCVDCPHVSIPENIKKLYERYAFDNFFLNCPLNCENNNGGFIGCTRKSVEINWEEFKKWLEENNVVSTTS